jgi:hypothetical protein
MIKPIIAYCRLICIFPSATKGLILLIILSAEYPVPSNAANIEVYYFNRATFYASTTSARGSVDSARSKIL